jgi:hypothetical protein
MQRLKLRDWKLGITASLYEKTMEGGKRFQFQITNDKYQSSNGKCRGRAKPGL